MTERPSRVKREFSVFRSPESPVSAFMRKDGTGKLLGWSSLRVMLFIELWIVAVRDPSTWTIPAVWALLGIPLMLILDTLAASIPVPEMLAAIQAAAVAAGKWAMDRAGAVMPGVIGTVTTEKESSKEKTITTPAVPVVPEQGEGDVT